MSSPHIENWGPRGNPRDPKKDLRDLIEIAERADKDHAIDTDQESGKQLVEAVLIMRNWWS